MVHRTTKGAKPISRVLASALVIVGALAFVGCEEKKDAPPPEPQLGKIAAAEAPSTIPAGNLHLGDRLPDFELKTMAGESLRLNDMIDGEHYVAVIFHSPLCPCALNCANAISDKLSDYDDLRIVGVVSDSAMSADWFRKDLEDQITNGVVNFPVVMDPERNVLELYGAKRTPTVWLADKQGVIRYFGAPENTLEPTESRYHFLMKEALDAMRRGETPQVQSFDPIGCLIVTES